MDRKLSPEDLVLLSAAIEMLAALVPWWTGVVLFNCLFTTYWPFTFGSISFIAGTALILRNPYGMVGQAIGMILLWAQMIGFHQSDDPLWTYYFESTGLELGMLFAGASIGLGIIAYLSGAYSDEDDDDPKNADTDQ